MKSLPKHSRLRHSHAHTHTDVVKFTLKVLEKLLALTKRFINATLYVQNLLNAYVFVCIGMCAKYNLFRWAISHARTQTNWHMESFDILTIGSPAFPYCLHYFSSDVQTHTRRATREFCKIFKLSSLPKLYVHMHMRVPREIVLHFKPFPSVSRSSSSSAKVAAIKINVHISTNWLYLCHVIYIL